LPDSPVREARKGVLKVDRRAGNQPEAVAVLAVDPVLAADLVAGLELGQVAGQVVEAVLVLAVDQVAAAAVLVAGDLVAGGLVAGAVVVLGVDPVAEVAFRSWSLQTHSFRLCRCR
jgi:hypothetical protein